MTEREHASPDSAAPDVPDAESVRFAAGALLDRLGELATQASRLGSEDDVDPVHRTRVACRRLRASMRLFDGCVESGLIRRWDRRIRRLARALGRARDLDVQSGFVDGFIQSIEVRNRPGLERLRLRLVQRRERASRRALGKAKRFRRRGIIESIEQRLRALQAKARIDRTAESGARGPRWLLAVSSERIMQLVEAMLVHEPFLPDPDRVEDLHAMRIAAKHLRYALEAIAPLHEVEAEGDEAPLDPRIDRALGIARSAQRVLGEIHDCDLWIEFLPRFLRGERRRTRRFYGHVRGFRRIARGIDSLLEDRRRARSALHAEFIEEWSRSVDERTWSDLRAALVEVAQEGRTGGAERAERDAESPQRESATSSDSPH
ncbi:MAG TPA: CHAD domain-containing protein [Phycisphaerales bacterium]|nr:CHAD domain-containing protein [Phycisphaerales bacterium]HMP36575.1 CHAD domain-containing protein [Phycisphaerales bacterium]